MNEHKKGKKKKENLSNKLIISYQKTSDFAAGVAVFYKRQKFRQINFLFLKT